MTERVNEVVENLLDNAVHAILEKPSGPEGSTVTVRVALNDALSAQLRVSDDGVGISATDRPYIFDFGFSTRKSKTASQGIGLWFCQYYAFQVGGKLTFDSTEGEGSWFEVEFPTIDA